VTIIGYWLSEAFLQFYHILINAIGNTTKTDQATYRNFVFVALPYTS